MKQAPYGSAVENLDWKNLDMYRIGQGVLRESEPRQESRRRGGLEGHAMTGQDKAHCLRSHHSYV